MIRTVIFSCLLFIIALSLPAQRDGNLTLKEGQVIQLQEEMTSNSFQTAGAQVINFKLNAILVHRYTVTGVTSINTITFRHEIPQLQFSFEGMGQKRNFDSRNEEDMKGPFGPYFAKISSLSCSVIVDSSGKKITPISFDLPYPLPKPDEKVVIIADMLKPLLQQTIYCGLTPGFLTGSSHGVSNLGSTWKEVIENENESLTTTYTLSSLTDSTWLVNLVATGTNNYVSEMMGRITKTKLNNECTGKIIFDRSSGLVSEKEITTNSKGTTEAMGGTVPVNGKCTIVTKVNLLKQ